MANPIFTSDGLIQILRWVHFMAGIVWIGHLYYFNFSQTPFFAEADGTTKSAVIRGLVPRALWWFRWGAAFTFFSGLFILHLMSQPERGGISVFQTSYGVLILLGAALGSIMAANVWFIIWPKQKIIIASALAVASGGQADPRAADAGARASVASRTNVLFSIPMLFFMGASRHLALPVSPETNFMSLFLVLTVLILLIQLNAMFGKIGPMKSIAGVIHLGLVLTVVLYGIASAML